MIPHYQRECHDSRYVKYTLHSQTLGQNDPLLIANNYIHRNIEINQ